jgi:poly-gamma-glutamate synthesis protein (capsule biosynthesis protein)
MEMMKPIHLPGLFLLIAFGLVFLFASLGAKRVSLAPSFSTPPSSSSSPSLLFVGDVMLGRHVETLWRRNGFDALFSGVSDLLSGPEVKIGNLEGPILSGEPQTPLQSLRFVFSPEILPALAPFSFLSLGNNHTWDYGSSGYLATVSSLRDAGVILFGHPLEEYDGVLLSSSTLLFGFNATYPSFSLPDAEDRVRDASSSLVIVFMHWGNEYELTPSPAERTIAEGLIDAGADLIVGAHPHVVQSIELYRGVPIFYSLGNFIFDQYFSPDVMEGLAVRMEMKEKPSYTLIPLSLGRTHPSPMTMASSSVFLSNLSLRSAPELREEIVQGVITSY